MEWLPAILILPYIFLMFRTRKSLMMIKPYIPSEKPSVPVSVIIACRNEEKALPNLLDCLIDQDYPVNLREVIIVDDHSSDRTSLVAASFSNLPRLKILRNQGQGKKSALKTGIDAASGELILTTDADCMMNRSWIRSFASFHEETRSDMIIGPVMLTPSEGFPGRFQELEFLSLQAITAGTAAAGNGTMCNGASLAFTKKAYYASVDNLRFDIATGDDVFLLHSMKKKKYKIGWLECLEAAVITRSTEGVKAFLRQRRRWASKSTAYTDAFSILLGIVTFVTVLLQTGYLVAGFFNPYLFIIFLAITGLKSIPDYLILKHTVKRYGKASLMKWFLPSQLIYPYYVLTVAFYALAVRKQPYPSSVGHL